MAHDVFITYSAHDKAVAEAVCATLESRHIRCWIAPRDILPGMEWAEAIVDAIDDSRALVLVLSSSSNSSPQVIREVGRAASKDIPILPLRIDDVPLSKAMEFFVSSHHYLDAQTPPLKKHLQRLADTVQQLLAQERGIPKRKEMAEAEEKAKREAEEARKAEAEERARREAELAAKEREKREAKEAKEKPAVSVERPAEAVKAVTKPNIWFWSGIVLLSLGLGLLTMVAMVLLDEEARTGDLFIGMLVFVLPLTIPGIYCLRRGMAQELRTKPAEGAVSNWWWWLPIVLGFVGGIISWVKQKDVNWHKAMNMLTLGIVATLIWTIPFFVFRAPATPLFPPPPPPRPPAVAPLPPPAPAPPPPPAPAPPPAPIVPGSPVTLRYETLLPSSDTTAMADAWFFNEVARLSGGLVEMEYHYEGPYSSTESSLLQAVGDGDIDCGLIVVPLEQDLIPLSQGLILHYLTYKPDALALAAREVYDTFTPLREEWEVDNNVKVVYFLPLDTAALCTTSPVSGVAGLEGRKIRSFGPALDTLHRLGAGTIFMPYAEIYTALQRGVIDGALIVLDGISSLKLFEVATYLTEPWAGPHTLFATVINKDVWDRLPADVKSLMEESRDDALEYYIRLIMEANRQAIEKMVTAGVNFYLWPQSEREAAKNLVQPAQTQTWIEEVGTSGQELITRLQQELAVYEPQSSYKSGFEIWEEEYGTTSLKLIYEDDFSDPDSGWERTSKEVCETDYKDDEYHIRVMYPKWSIWRWNVRPGQLTDFALEIDARLVSGSNQSAYGVVFRAKDDGNFYCFDVTADGAYLLGGKLDGKWFELQKRTDSAFIKEGNSTNHLKVVCRGSQIEVYVNGHHLTSATDNSFNEGYIGVIATSVEPDIEVAFDNIRAYSGEEYETPSPKLMYEDDFSDPDSGWLRESYEDREYDYEAGEYHILVKEFDWSAWAWNRNVGRLTDFTLEIDARLVSGPNESSYGVIFRLKDGDNFYRFLVSGDGYYLVGMLLDDEWIELQSKTKSAFIKEGNSTNHLKVVCQDSQIEVYVNGHHLTTVTDNSFAEGYVGVTVDTIEPTSHVAFDNIRIYRLD
ncbi:hypothetical protein ES703_24547 [subsurface metagenome]